MNNSEKVLSGGNMNSPILKDQLVYKEATVASSIIHELLTYVRARGVTWVPESHGIDSNGKHVLSYLEGEVPHDTPEWLWKDTILLEAAGKLRQWHDATIDFKPKEGRWLLENDEKQEIICHNDFAPYNCVFQDKHLTGVIDFDVCSPGSRLWDIVYTAYRFVPLLPIDCVDEYGESSPFSYEIMKDRLERFLYEYSRGEDRFLYGIPEVFVKLEKRLLKLADWSENFGNESHNNELITHAKMYRFHAKWLNEKAK